MNGVARPFTLPDAINPTKISTVCSFWNGSVGFVEGDGIAVFSSDADMVV